MTKPNRLGLYADVRKVLDAALEAGGGDFHCQDHGAAIHWRQRAYQFRKAYAAVYGERKESPYDILVLPRIAPDTSTVSIEVRTPAGVFEPRNGGVTTDFSPEDELEAAAQRLARSLGGL